MESLTRLIKYSENFKDILNNVNKDPHAFDTTKSYIVYGETQHKR